MEIKKFLTCLIKTKRGGKISEGYTSMHTDIVNLRMTVAMFSFNVSEMIQMIPKNEWYLNIQDPN